MLANIYNIPIECICIQNLIVSCGTEVHGSAVRTNGGDHQQCGAGATRASLGGIEYELITSKNDQ
jgi:hypothetical protein